MCEATCTEPSPSLRVPWVFDQKTWNLTIILKTEVPYRERDMNFYVAILKLMHPSLKSGPKCVERNFVNLDKKQ
jgi:hypothetical protein